MSVRVSRSISSDPMVYPKCDKKKDHTKESLNLVCLTESCKNRGLICSMCKAKDHAGHHVIPLREFFNKMQASATKDRELHDQESAEKDLESLQKNHIEVLTSFRAYVTELSEMVRKVEQEILESYQDLLKAYTYESNKESLILETAEKFFTAAFEDNFELRTLVEKLIPLVKGNQFDLCNQFTQKKNGYELRMVTFIQNLEVWERQSFKIVDEIFSKKIESAFSCNKADRPVTAVPSSNKLSSAFSTIYRASNISLSNENKVAKVKEAGGKIVFLNQNVVGKPATLRIKILSLAATSQIGVGIGMRQLVKSKGFKFEKTLTGHGLYLLTSNCLIYSHLDSKDNNVYKGFQFKANDELIVTVEDTKLIFRKKSDVKAFIQISLNGLKDKDWKEIGFCVYLAGLNDKVQLL